MKTLPLLNGGTPNTRTVKGKFTTTAIAILGASYTNGRYNLKLGHTYQFVVHSTKRPAYYDAAPAPTAPFKLDQNFRAAGHHRWVLDVTITHSLHHYKNWNLGVKIGMTMQVLPIRVS